MSTASLILNVSDQDKSGLLASFTSTAPGQLGRLFRKDSSSIEVYGVKVSPSGARLWDSASLDPSTFRLVVGGLDLPPVSGIAKLSWDGSTATINFDDADTDISSKLNALSSITAAGGITARRPANVDGTFEVTWVDNGARDLLIGDAYTLDPQCNIVVTRVQAGDSTHQEIQLVQFVQKPLIDIASWSALSMTIATITELRTGSVSAKAKYQIVLTSLTYGGTFSVDSSDGTGSSVSFSTTAADLSASMAGDWSATKIDDYTWTVERNAVGVATIDLSTGVVTAGLSVYSGITGAVSINASAIWRKFATTTLDYIESDVQILSGTETLYFESGVRIYRDLLNGTASGFPTVDFQSGSQALVSGALTGTVTFPTAMSIAPKVFLSVESPSGEGPLFAAPIKSTISTTGFQFVLLGAPTSNNSVLDYLATAV